MSRALYPGVSAFAMLAASTSRRRAPSASALGCMPKAASISLLMTGTFPSVVSAGQEQAPCQAAEFGRAARITGASCALGRKGSGRKRQWIAGERQKFAALAAADRLGPAARTPDSRGERASDRRTLAHAPADP